jgi:hypothetical protein
VVRRSKLFKFQARPRLAAVEDGLPALADDDLKWSVSEATQSDDEDASVCTASSDAATTVPGVALERRESGDSLDAVPVQLKGESMETLLQRVPKNEKGEVMSVGSIAHEDGTCKPCVFAHSERKTCESGVQCLFCHFEHVQKKRQRLSKKNRMATAQPKESMRFRAQGC